jgi:tRNA(Ile)-lysidine synthetase-like protein
MEQRRQIELDVPEGGKWAVGVSGGADSVALLLLLRDRPDLQLHVVHLNHELRGPDSEMDAAFVEALCSRMGLACHVRRRSEIEPGLGELPANPSARYRAVRLAWFGQVVREHQLAGVMLAHHADDVAETVLHRLVRGSGAGGLSGMAAESRIGELRIARPLLNVRRDALRELLRQRGQEWREDASNQTEDYLRNRLRKLLSIQPALTGALLELAARCRSLNDWTSRVSPQLEKTFAAAKLARLPAILARHSARRWLIDAGAPAEELVPTVLDRLLAMAADATAPRVQQFPGKLTVRRHARMIGASTPH